MIQVIGKAFDIESRHNSSYFPPLWNNIGLLSREQDSFLLIAKLTAEMSKTHFIISKYFLLKYFNENDTTMVNHTMWDLCNQLV
jgi:hypothetical protein